jgi:hypothetical protein
MTLTTKSDDWRDVAEEVARLQELISDSERVDLWEYLVEEIATLEEHCKLLRQSNDPKSRLELAFATKKLSRKQELLAAIDVG